MTLIDQQKALADIIAKANKQVLKTLGKKYYANHTLKHIKRVNILLLNKEVLMNNINPFTKFDKQWALVSAGDKDKSNTMTISWGGLGTIWNKSVAFVFIRDSRYTKEFMDKFDNFSVAFFDESFRNSLTLCGRVSGRDCNKWKEAGLTPVATKGTVYPKEAKEVLICKKLLAVKLTKDTFIDMSIDAENYKDKDYHTMYIGEVVTD